jgi:hypothetical protein
MVVQFLGHIEGCLEWFYPADCTPTPTPTPPPCPDGYNNGEPFIILRDDGGCSPEDLIAVENALLGLGYSNITRVEEIPNVQYAWYAICCGQYCEFAGAVNVCGVPYNVCSCSPNP